VSALHWEDITIDPVTPEKSRLRVSKSLKWCRRAGAKPALENGFKNSGSSKLKEQPMFPKTHEALMSIFCGNSKGPIFLNNGNFFTYRQLQYAYETAFASAGLTQRGTHVMRHGGCRNIFNKVPDVTVAQQLLGNSSLQTTMVYAKRRASALTEVANAEWEDHMARGKEIAMCRK
jgi:integrase